jgi:Fe-S-cluster containining protein
METLNKMDDFECQRCGACCLWSGYVRLFNSEVDEIATFLGMSSEAFIETYTRLTSDRTGLSLVENEDGSCPFYDKDKNLCEINDVKPIQCQNFPMVWNFKGWENECAWGIKSRKNKNGEIC